MKIISKIYLFFAIFAIFVCPFTNRMDVYADERECLDYDTPPNATQPSPSSNYESFLVSYFDNLTHNFGKNVVGSCGYVALGMFLSYYDTCLSDDIIPDNYEVKSEKSFYNLYADSPNMIKRDNSPGVRYDNLAAPDGVFTPQSYYNAISQIADISLHAKLITIGNELNYYDFNPEEGEYAAGTDAGERTNILKKYLSKEIGLTDDVDFNTATEWIGSSEHIRNTAILKVQSGIPVILGVSGEFEKEESRSSSEPEMETRGHSVVAYDYDEENDLLYCHMGWDNNTTHDTVESHGYTDFISCSWVTWNLSHLHSDNYGVTIDGVTTHYCSCSNEIYTYHNGHRYDNDYKTYTIGKHESLCICGESIYENHIMVGSICSLCLSYHSPHDYSYNCVKIDEDIHKKYCECGAFVTSLHNINNDYYCSECGYFTYQHIHNFVYIPSVLGLRHTKTCKKCRYSTQENCIGQAIWGSEVKYCSKCGQEIGVHLPPIIFGDDENLLENVFLQTLKDKEILQEQ